MQWNWRKDFFVFKKFENHLERRESYGIFQGEYGNSCCSHVTLSYVGRYVCDMWGVVYDRRLSRLMYRRCPCLLLEKLDVLLWLSMNDSYALYVTHHHCHTIPPLLKMSTPPRLSTSIPYTVLACTSLYLSRFVLLHSPFQNTSIIILSIHPCISLPLQSIISL